MSDSISISVNSRNQRKLVLAASVCALALLMFSLWFALSARGELNGAMIRLSDMQRQDREILAFEEAHSDWQAYQSELQDFRQALEQAGLSAAQWRERGLTVENARMSRRQAQAYLTSLAREEGYYFVPERFEMRVLRDSDDLLRWRDDSTDELEMTLVGRYFIRSTP